MTAVPPPVIRLVAATSGTSSTTSISATRALLFSFHLRLGKSTEPQKSIPKFSGHKVIEDGIDCRVEVEHHPAKIDNTVVTLITEGNDGLNDGLWRVDYDPEGQCSEGKKTDEKAENHRSQHQDHLFAMLEQIISRTPTYCRICHQMLSDDCIENKKDHKRNDEEDNYGCQEKGICPC